tara:strand:- start:3296 stop:3655 length:360 start_codon:yes stop_codon:yes gene_type:complete
MKISKQRLKCIIKEELESALGPLGVDEEVSSWPPAEELESEVVVFDPEDIGLAPEAEETDEEVGMTVNQLQSIAATALELSDMVKDLEHVPEWGQGKVATVLDRLNSLRSYMLGKSIGR